MLRSHFFWRLYVLYLVLLFATTTAVGLWIEASARQETMRETENVLLERAETLLTLARPWLATSDIAKLRAEVVDIGRFSGARLTVIAADGAVLADSDEDPEQMDNHLGRPEVRDALARGVGRSTRFSDTLRETYMYVAIPVRSEASDAPIGVVRVSLPIESLAGRLERLRSIVVIGMLLAALLGLWGGALFARRVTRPLQEMTSLAEAITRGEYGRAVGHRGPDEIGRLATALNAMAGTLRERMEIITGDRNKVLAILASMVEGVVAVDKDERVVHMNEVAGRLLRVSPEGSVGRRIWEVTRVVEVPRILDAAREQAGETSGEVHLPGDVARLAAGANDGRTIELRASPLRDGSGGLAGAVVVLHDVTALRRLEGVRRDFVANVSHELKTPLTAIRGLVETLLDDQRMPEPTRRRFLEKIRDQSVRLASLVADLLTLARIESQEPPTLDPRPLDLRGPVRESAARFATLAQAKGLTLEVELPGAPLIVRGDDEALRTIVDNLLDNAVKYTPASGRISLRVRAGAPAPEGGGGEALIEVEDTGIGIEPRHQDRIFERFYRVDKARSRELGGTGLGLSIVKHLVLTLGGRVSIESVPGRGSSFRVHLPSLTRAENVA